MHAETIKLINAAAQLLTGKRVEVREREPGTAGLLGEISKRKDGVLVIDLSPEIPNDKKRLDVLLHELAHAKHHNYITSNHAELRPASVKKQPLDWGDRLREDTAEKQAAAWKQYADKHAHPDFVKIAPFTAKIISLLTYKENTK